MSIVPDTKDWTWVLRGPCPECGQDVGKLTRDRIAPLLREAAAVWVDVLGSGGPGLARRPRPEVWSTLEYGCHARDVNRTFIERLGKIRTEDDAVFANWDQDATAVEQNYAAQDPARVAEELAESADELADGFASLGEHEWTRSGRRSDGAEFTAETLGQYLLHDVLHHLWDIGRPLPASGS